MRRLIGLAIILLSFLMGWFWMDYETAPQRPVRNTETVVIEVPRGLGLKPITEMLVRRGVLDKPLWFMLHAYQDRVAGQLKFGEYEIPAGISQARLLEMLVAGRVKQYALTVPEGWTYRQLIQLLRKQSAFLPDPSLDDDRALMSALGVPGSSPEGWFFPDTYFYHKGMSSLEVLRQAHRKMRTVLEQEWSRREPGLPLASAYEALILASIVEKETASPEERPLIAGVFLRRLAQDMLLQTDPTVIYGMGEAYRGDIHKDDLMRDTPYNTYLHRGLPPTPIALPGMQAIRAVLHPAPGESLYFVARGDGKHEFSNTLDEHHRAVEQYQMHKP